MLVRRHLHYNAAICAGLAPGMILHLHVWSTTSASMRCLSEDVQCPAAPAYVQGVLICVVHSTALCQSGAIVPQAAHEEAISLLTAQIRQALARGVTLPGAQQHLPSGAGRPMCR